MNVVVEPKPNCVATLRVELESERVRKELTLVTKEFQRNVKIPGFRPGKAPQAIVEKKFASEIKSELTDRLMRQSLKEAIDREKLRILSVSKVDDVEITDDQSMRYTATLITSPDFEVPDYSKIDLDIKKPVVTDAEIEEMMQSFAAQHAEFKDIEGRPLAMGDFAILSYEGKLDGAPLPEAVADCPPLLAGKPNWWVRMEAGTLAQGFCEALVGLSRDESKSFELELPADFAFPPLAGKKVSYDATLHEIRERVMPELTDELAEKIQPGQTIAAVRDTVREMLTRKAKSDFENAKRNGAIQHLLSRVNYEIPAHMVNNAMTGILREIVEENQGRGVSDEELRGHQDEIMGAAKQTASQRVRTSFLLLRIAEKENLEVSQEEMVNHIAGMAEHYEIPVKKLITDLKRRNALGQIREQILAGKALDLVSANVTVRDPQGAA